MLEDYSVPGARWPGPSELPRWKRGGEVGEKSVVDLIESMCSSRSSPGPLTDGGARDPGFYEAARHRRRIDGEAARFPCEPRFNDVGPGSVGTHTEADVNPQLEPGRYNTWRYPTGLLVQKNRELTAAVEV